MKTIGSILLDVELVIPEDIERALALQKQTGQRLGEVLVSLGIVSDDDIRWALAEQLNLPYVNIRKDQIDVEVATILPEKLARRYHVIPILKIDDELTVVVDDPLNTTIIKDIEAITKSRVKVSLGRTSDIMLAIDEIYGSVEDELEKVQETPPNFVSAWFGEDDIQQILNDPSGQALLQSVLENALSHNVSRIYFQPGYKTCTISYRVNGVLQPQIQLGKEWYSIAMFRLKISGGFELAKTRSPQTREISYREHILGKHAIEGEEHANISMSIFPTEAGEAARLHIMNKSLDTMEDIALETAVSPSQQQDLEAISALRTALQHLKSGAVLLGGTPYPDKITTLYSLLSGLNPVRKNILTFEAYTEYRTDKYSQIRYGGGDSSESLRTAHAAGTGSAASLQNISPDALEEGRGIQFPDPSQAALSSWLTTLQQHDADAILVDNIDSQIVLSQCIEFAAHHLLLGAFDCQQIFDILAYCLECQVKPSVLVSRVYALLAQQTIHLLCQQCKQPDTSDFSKQFVEQLSSGSDGRYQGLGDIFAPAGCPVCHETGYSEQVVLFEVLKMEPWLKEMIVANTPLADIRNTAVEKGFSSLEHKSIELFLTGKTSIDQILSIVT